MRGRRVNAAGVGRLRLRRRPRSRARDLYFAVVARARDPALYRAFGVPDTIDGRFEMIVLHAILVFRRLRDDPAGAELSDGLFETMTDDFDRSLREMGLGDVRVGKRVRQMARGFYGRAQAYDRGLAAAEPLEEAVRRNVFGTVAPTAEQVAAMADYVRRAAAALDRAALADLLAARLELPPARATDV